MRHRQAFGLGSSVATLGAIAMLAAPGAASAASSAVHLRGSVAPAASSPRVGSVAGGTSVDFEVQLNLSDPSGAAAVAKAVSTPGNAQYRKYLTPAQWEAALLAVGGRRRPRHGVPEGERIHRPRRLGRPDGGLGLRHRPRRSSTRSPPPSRYHRVDGQRLAPSRPDLSVPASLAGVVARCHRRQPDARSSGPHDRQSGHPGHGFARSRSRPGFRVAPPCGDLLQPEDRHVAAAISATAIRRPPPWAVCGYKPPQFRSAYNLTGSTTEPA